MELIIVITDGTNRFQFSIEGAPADALLAEARRRKVAPAKLLSRLLRRKVREERRKMALTRHE